MPLIANSESEIVAGNPYVAITIAKGSLEQSNVVELNCALNGNGIFYITIIANYTVFFC